MDIALSKLTKGILPDFAFSLGNVNALVTRGAGATGSDPGFYFTADTNLIGDLVNCIKPLIGALKPILESFGLPTTFTLPPLGMKLALMVGGKMIGFNIDLFGAALTCFLKYDGFKFSCKFNGNIFSLLWEGLKLLAKKVAQFFENVGKEIANFAKESWNKGIQAANKFIHGSVGKIKDAAGHFVKLGTKEFKKLAATVGKEVQKAKESIKKGFADVKKGLSTAGKAIGNEFKKFGNTIGKHAKKFGNFFGGAAKNTGRFFGGAAKSAGRFFGGAASSAGRSFGGAAKSAGKAVAKIFKGW
jgi:hypothetical protein